MKNFDPLDTRGQERDKEDRELLAQAERENEKGDIKWLMGSRRGRRIVWRLMDQSGVFRLSFDTNAMTMSFREGNRNFGNRTLATIHEVCPELYPVMVKECNGSDGDGPKSN